MMYLVRVGMSYTICVCYMHDQTKVLLAISGDGVSEHQAKLQADSQTKKSVKDNSGTGQAKQLVAVQIHT